MRTRLNVILAAAALTTLTATVAQAELVLGLTTDNKLVSFNSSTPGTLTSTVSITGLASGEFITGIDLRASNFTVLGVGTGNNIYTINPTTGVATLIGAGNFTPGLPTGTTLGFDVNPTVDRIRGVSTAGDNFRLNPQTGGFVQFDTTLSDAAGGVPHAAAVAYTNSQFGGVPTGSVREYIIDSAKRSLGEVGSQAGGNASFNGGVVTTVGSLGVSNITDLVGFDIFGPTGLALASFNDINGGSTLYSIDLGTGAAASLGGIGNFAVRTQIRDITIIPEPTSAALLGLVAPLALRRKR